MCKTSDCGTTIAHKLAWKTSSKAEYRTFWRYPLAVRLETIRYAAQRDTVHKLGNIFHREQCSLAVFKAFVGWRRGCEVITEEIINITIIFNGTTAVGMLKRNHVEALAFIII